MSERFNDCFKVLMRHEGGWVNDSKDPGGETKFGISKKQYPHIDIASLTRDQAKEIYKRDYWDALNCEEYTDVLALNLFDAAVNHGRGNAVRIMQRAIGVADDGRVGPITKTGLNRAGPDKFNALFNAERIKFYRKLSAFKRFGKGWMDRVAENLKICAELI